MTLTSVSRPSLVDVATEGLRKELENGVWPVGTRLPVEASLADRLGVSRNTLREAVRVLVHAGLLETRQGAGTFVRSLVEPGHSLRRIERAGLEHQLEVRMMLEVEAATLAAVRRSADDLQAMTEALDARAAAKQDIALRIQHDHRFHQALVRASGNPALAELYQYFADAVTRTIEHTELDEDLPEPSQADHELLLAAVRRREPEQAAVLARALLKPSLEALKPV